MSNHYIRNRGKIPREEIIRAASKVFKEKGYENGRLEDIANELGILKGSLYYYIDNKEDLLLGVVELPIKEITEKVEEIADSDEEPIEKIRLIVEAHLHFIEDHSAALSVYLERKWDKNNPNYIKVFELGKRHEDAIIRVIEDGIKKKQIYKGMDPKVIAYTILAICNWPYRWYKPNGRYSIKEISTIITNLCLNGIDNKNYK